MFVGYYVIKTLYKNKINLLFKYVSFIKLSVVDNSKVFCTTGPWTKHLKRIFYRSINSNCYNSEGKLVRQLYYNK